MNALKFVIVGHVDHGKSTLIGRLLFDTKFLQADKMAEIERSSRNLGRETEFAFLLDHLQEEREQGITIDTAQTFFKHNGKEYVIIDAPGHIEFVKNMITGASQAEAAILIVDANEGVQEQTKRHANILSMLGIRQVIVVINKMDLVGYMEDPFIRLKNEIENFLSTIKIRPTYYIPIGALKGDNVANRSVNMYWYKGPTVLEAFDFFKANSFSVKKLLFFPVQDVYKIDNKRVIVGKLESGKIFVGQKIIVVPDKRITEVKTIEKFGEAPIEAFAGENIGITTKDPFFIERGTIICEEGGEPRVTDKFEANIFLISREDLMEGESLVLRCVTEETVAKIEKIKKRINSSSLEILETNASAIKNLEVGEVFIKTVKPIAIAKFSDNEALGRFVLVKDGNICAGGIIV